MLKNIFILIFTLFISSNIFAESHSIPNQILDTRIEKIKNSNNISLERNITNLEKNINEHLSDNSIHEQNKLLILIKNELIKNNLNTSLNKSNLKTWSPSDWGTVTIAILTLFLVVFTGLSLYLLKKQNEEQSLTNKKNINILKNEQKQQFNSMQLNHLDKQIDNLLSSLEKIEEELKIFLGSYIDLSLIENNEYKVNLFSFKFQGLIILINKALKYGYDLESLRINLGKYRLLAQILYNRNKIDEGTYRHYKIMVASSIHIGRDININLNDKFSEELKIELGDFDKTNILNIRYFHGKTSDDLLIKFELKLKNGTIYKRDEKGKWTF